MTAGSIQAIIFEIKNGNFFTVLDEVLHALDFVLGNFEWRFRFCQWAHRDDMAQAVQESGVVKE